MRKTFLELVLATLATAPLAGCPPRGGSCGPAESGALELPDDLEEGMAQELARCRAEHTTEACRPLCEAALTGQIGGRHITACDVDDGGDDSPLSPPLLRYTTHPRCIGGRRPDGYAAAPVPDGVGGFLAEQARLEHASVRAFADLARALVAHRAPASLARRARAASIDEARHARACDALARARGVAPRYQAAGAAEVPGLEALAADNAVEGCVRESWGALVATWQARAAGDPAIRAAMAAIAPDETAHAALSDAIDRWALARLPPAARRRVEAARAEAIAALEVDAPAPALIAEAGLPTPEAAQRLVAGWRYLTSTARIG